MIRMYGTGMGDIDEVRLWKKALTAQEINAIKDTEVSVGQNPDLVAYYKILMKNQEPLQMMRPETIMVYWQVERLMMEFQPGCLVLNLLQQ